MLGGEGGAGWRHARLEQEWRSLRARVYLVGADGLEEAARVLDLADLGWICEG